MMTTEQLVCIATENRMMWSCRFLSFTDIPCSSVQIFVKFVQQVLRAT